MKHTLKYEATTRWVDFEELRDQILAHENMIPICWTQKDFVPMLVVTQNDQKFELCYYRFDYMSNINLNGVYDSYASLAQVCARRTRKLFDCYIKDLGGYTDNDVRDLMNVFLNIMVIRDDYSLSSLIKFCSIMNKYYIQWTDLDINTTPGPDESVIVSFRFKNQVFMEPIRSLFQEEFEWFDSLVYNMMSALDCYPNFSEKTQGIVVNRQIKQDKKGPWLELTVKPVPKTSIEEEVFPVRKEIIKSSKKRFCGTIRDLIDWLDKNQSVIGIKLASDFDGEGYDIILYTNAKGEFADGRLICANGANEWGLMSLFEKNISRLFRINLSMLQDRYNPPYDWLKDAQNNCFMFTEKEIILNAISQNGFPIDFNELRRRKIWKDDPYVSWGDLHIEFKWLEEGDDSNHNTNHYFDCIVASVPIVKHGATYDEMLKNLSEPAHKGEITSRILSRIAHTPKFRDLGYSLNIFEISSIVLTRDMHLVYIFDLKRELRMLFVQ